MIPNLFAKNKWYIQRNKCLKWNEYNKGAIGSGKVKFKRTKIEMTKHLEPVRAKNNYLSFAWCDKMRDDDKTWQETKDRITAEKSLNRMWGYRRT